MMCRFLAVNCFIPKSIIIYRAYIGNAKDLILAPLASERRERLAE
jgi:hypothetical protein